MSQNSAENEPYANSRTAFFYCKILSEGGDHHDEYEHAGSAQKTAEQSKGVYPADRDEYPGRTDEQSASNGHAPDPDGAGERTDDAESDADDPDAECTPLMARAAVYKIIRR